MTTTDSSPFSGVLFSSDMSPSGSGNSSVEDALLLTPEEAARRLSVGRTTVYALMTSGELLSVNIGRCRRVPVSSLRSFVARLVDNVGADEHHW